MPVTIKILIAGGFGVGKTTLVSSVSEIRPLRTEEHAERARHAPVDSLDGVERKSTTTVAMDFGRITISDDLLIYLFGTPGQERFWFMWDELAHAARSARSCWPTPAGSPTAFRRSTTSSSAACLSSSRSTASTGPGASAAEDIRSALDLDPEVPVVMCDARRPASGRDVLVTLVEHALDLLGDRPGRPAPVPAR